MKYDVVIIGGGLAGLVSGLKLQKAGKNCLIVSSGQNAMHFSSGSFGFLSKNTEGETVEELFEGLDRLGPEHPYSIIGKERTEKYALETKDFFASAGIPLVGNPQRNSMMLSPLGISKPFWLALEDTALTEDFSKGGKAVVFNFKGFLDFNPSLISLALERKGISCAEAVLDLPELSRLRENPSEMRSVNIARVVDKAEVLDKLISQINSEIKDEETVVLPAVFGLWSDTPVRELRSRLRAKTVFVGTMSPSVPGIRSQLLLKKAFEAAGGTFLLGDNVCKVIFDGAKVASVRTSNLGDTKIEARDYILAAGSFFSKGLQATPSAIIEPLMGLDVSYPQSREQWYQKSFFANHEYLNSGLIVDSNLHPLMGGWSVENLYAAGSIIGGARALALGCGAGTTIITAMAAADNILNDNAGN